MSRDAGGVVQHAKGSTHRARTVAGSEQGGGAEHSLERVAGEPVVEEVAGGEGENAQQLHDIAPAEPGGPNERPQETDALLPGEVVEGWGGVVEGDSQDTRHRVQVVDPFGEGGCVGPVVTGDFVAGGGGIAPEGQRLPAAQQRSRQRGRFHPVETGRAEAQVREDLTPEQPRVLRGHADAAPGKQLFRRGGAAHRATTFQHEDLPLLAGEPGCRHQCVVAASHDDRVVLLHPTPLPRSPDTTPAASFPGAPMIPPPGCVPDPHW